MKNCTCAPSATLGRRSVRRLFLLSLIACAVALPVSGSARAAERENRTKIDWSGRLPAVLDAEQAAAAEDAAKDEAPRPLMVVIRATDNPADQRRFDSVVVQLELITLTSKFFDNVRISERQARAHPLFNGIQFKAPAMVCFDSTRKHHSVALGRASARKAFNSMRKVIAHDYKTKVDTTLTKARVLLGRFDQVDAARAALGIKEQRREKALADGNRSRAAALDREIAKDRRAFESLYADTEEKWQKLWQLERR